MAKNRFDTFGIMLDMSRNSVMKLSSLKEYMVYMKKMGYNALFLYIEDTYEVDGEPYFGYMRGRYTKEEMKELDAYGESLGIEVIPCMQTLAHIKEFLRWGKAPVDKDDVLLVGEERTYELIDHMFSTLSECFKTRRIHIGMDEAHSLGRGAYLDKHGYEPTPSIMKKHLARVKEIAAKYGYENPMIWSDMFFRPWNNRKYYIGKCEMPKEYLDALPEGIIPVYWDYYHYDFEIYDGMMYNHRQLDKNFWFAGGAWTWTGYMPHNDFTLETMLPAFEALKKYRVKNVMITLWGDDGGECSRYSVLPSLLYLAEVARGNTDEGKIKAKFKRIFGVEYDDFMLLDQLDHVVGSGEGAEKMANPSKYALVSDTFYGFLDHSIEPNAAHRYIPLTEALASVAKKTRRFHPVFDTAAKLSSVLEIKYDLGLRLRAAYKAKDKDALLKLATEDYPTAIRRLNLFARAVEKQWLFENKPAGLEAIHLRHAAVRERLDYARRTILSYLDGSLDTIAELDEGILPEEGYGVSTHYNNALAALIIGKQTN